MRTKSIRILLICLAVSLACVVYPIYVIRPFRAQGAGELSLALLVSRFRPVVTILSSLVAVLAVIFYWRARRGWWRVALAGLGALLVCGLAALARVNVYEIMFRPNRLPTFTAASAIKLEADEKVIAVKLGAAARAYPVRNISYHHVINDVVDNQGIVATY